MAGGNEMKAPIDTVRRASFHAITVELQPHELPPPPDAARRLIDCLERAAGYAAETGEDMAAAVAELITNARLRVRKTA